MSQFDALERYQILHLIGRGGMGLVYCARDTRLQRNVALKVLRAYSDGDEARADRAPWVARMVREARAAAALAHPNIVAIHDVGEFPMRDGEPLCFIAMELIEGVSLRAFIGRSDIPVERRLEWLADVARALAFAHSHGIIHRDIKPDNVMIRDDGVVKVLDFGLARRTEGVAPPMASEVLPTLTEEGKVLGTPLYMAPEQMGGTVLDGRADQFSWGVIAYELLAGKPPWPAGRDSIQVVAQMLMHEPPPLRTLQPAISPVLAEIVHRALARDRENRFASMDAVLEAIETVVPSATPHRAALGLTRPRGWFRPGVVVALALAAASVVVGMLLTRMHFGARAAGGSCDGDAECGPGWACRNGKCEGRNGCRSNAECTRSRGAPAICRADTATCVALGSEDCHVVSEASDLDSDATVWFGTMFPLSGVDARSFGTREFQAVELARSDFAEMLGGANGRPDSRVHPLAIVACDDSVDPWRAARHLVDDVGVPAIIGFRTSREIIDLATSIFIPRGVLTMAALNTSPFIANLPRAAGQPRMVFRTTYSSAQAAVPIGVLVSEVLEPAIRAPPTGLHGDVPLRVALVRQDDAAGIGFADSLFRALRFNGRSALENESGYREIVYAFDTSDGKPADFDQVVDKLLAFAPNVVIHFGANEALLRIVEPLERAWKEGTLRPRYVKPTNFTPEVLAFAGKTVDRRRRFFSMTSVSTTPANARFVARYADRYGENVTRTFSPNSSYDAFYVLAYATLALGNERVTGASLARAIGRLLPPGRPIDVGPSGIFDARNTLAAGEAIDLNGATGRLDFDTNTGEAPVDLAVLCVEADASGGEGVESGLIYDARAGALRGAMHCP
jgi:serine/threonine-protein kinase